MTRRRSIRGQATLEIAIVGILFIVVVIGLVEVGRAVLYYNTLAQATREGARYAIVHGSRSDDPSGPGSPYYTAPNQDTKITDAASKHAGGLDLDNLSVSAEWLDGTNERDARVKVSTSYEFESIFSQFFGLPAITLSSSSQMAITY